MRPCLCLHMLRIKSFFPPPPSQKTRLEISSFLHPMALLPLYTCTRENFFLGWGGGGLFRCQQKRKKKNLWGGGVFVSSAHTQQRPTLKKAKLHHRISISPSYVAPIFPLQRVCGFFSPVQPSLSSPACSPSNAVHIPSTFPPHLKSQINR